MPKHQPVALFTDSTSSIPADLIERYHIVVVPLHIIWGAEDMLDGIEISTQQFYHRLPKDPIHPKTSQPNSQQFVEALQQAKESGAKEALIVTISTELSKTFNSAVQAKEAVNMPVHVFDSKSAAMGLGWQLIAAARAQEAGGEIAAMLAAAERARDHMALMLTVDTLEYLHKGGRIGGASKLLGTALNIRPQLSLNHKKGSIEAGKRSRTRKKSLDSVYKAFFDAMDTSKPMHITVHHAATADEGEELAARIRAEYKPQELFVTDLPPVIGVHVGPGAMGIAGYYE